MRAWGGFALALSLLLVIAEPATSHHTSSGATVVLLDEAGPLPRWHSAIVAWDGTKSIEGEMTRDNPQAEKWVQGGDDPMSGSAVIFEYRDPDGSWRWFAALEGKACECSMNDARVRVLAPIELDIEHHPYLRVIQNNSLGWRLTGTSGTYRITTYAAAEHEGNSRFVLRAEPGVTLLNHTEGDRAGFERADDTALVSAGANAFGHGMWARAIARVDMTIEQTAFISDFVDKPPYQGCVCRYTGPDPDWDGRVTTAGSVFGGPRGTYTIEVIASQNSDYLYLDPGNPTRIVPRAYNHALAWLWADVEPAEV